MARDSCSCDFLGICNPVTGHVAAQISGCGPACLPALLEGAVREGAVFFGFQSAAGYECGADWGTVGPLETLPLSLCLFLSLLVLGGQRASGVGGPGALSSEVGGRWGIGMGAGVCAPHPQFNPSLGPSLQLEQEMPTPVVLSTHTPCLTCRHEEDASAQDDVVACLVKLACSDAETTHEEQDHTQDWEDTRGPHGPCRTQSTEAQ